MTKQVKILSLPTEQFLAVCYSDKKYMNAIDEVISRFADYYLDEIIVAYLEGCNGFSIGLYNQNYIKVSDPDRFFDAMTRKAEEIATSDKVIKAVEKCKKLKDANSNLFGYTVENELRDAIMDEAKSICDYYEALSYEVYSKNTSNEQLNDFVFNNIQLDEDLAFDGLVVDLETGAITDTSVQTYVGSGTLDAIKQALAKQEQE